MPIAELGLPAGLPALVEQKYAAAKAQNALTFSETQLAILYLDTLPFQVRLCPALSNKPPAVSDRPRTPKPDPFEKPPDALLVARVPTHRPTHTLVLNKYPIIPQHFILATIPYKEQTQLLEAEDLQVTYACLKAWGTCTEGPIPDRRLFAFFNSGRHSGASQNHRHIQFLPIEDMGAMTTWKPLIDLMDKPHSEEAVEKLPFTYFHTSIPEDPNPLDLLETYILLYQKAVAAEHSAPDQKLNTTAYKQNEATISYNLAMTTNTMAICPRTSEGTSLSDGTSDQDPGSSPVALNGTILAGTLMVKSETDWINLQQDPEQLRFLLQSIGVPPTTR